MNAKFTPGPWTTENENELRWNIFDQYGNCVALANQVTPLKDDFHQFNRDANAKLIAAAPDMLNALVAIAENAKEAVSMFAQQMSESHWNEEDQAEMTKWENILIAIEKATI